MIRPLLHHLRGHHVQRRRCHWYDPPGEPPQGPYDWFICQCGKEWVYDRPRQHYISIDSERTER